MTEPFVVHTTFVIERTYPASPERVFKACSERGPRLIWFGGVEGCQIDQYELDFRVGGSEFWRFRFQDGPEIRNDTVYQDIVDNRRIVFAYSMTVGEKRISSSLATMELRPVKGGTQFVYTEQGAFFDGADSATGREAGCRDLFERLAEYLRQQQ